MSTLHAFLDRRSRAPAQRTAWRRGGPELIAFALFVAVLAAEIAVIVRAAPVVDPLSLIYSGP